MSRDARSVALPAGLLVMLWGSVAAWVHLGLGATGYVVAAAHDDRKAISELAERVRERVRETEQTFDVAPASNLAPIASVAPAPAPTPPPPKKSAETRHDPPKPDPTVEAKKPEPPKPEPKVVVAVKPDPTPPLVQPPQPKPDKRIAVRQHVTPNQADNPNARFIGDEANHVEAEQVATLTSHDRDDEHPTPAGSHQNPTNAPGDSDTHKIAESDEHRGAKDRAPGERGSEFDVQRDPPPERPMGAVAMRDPAPSHAPAPGGDGRTAAAAPSPTPQPAAGGAAAPAAPDVQAASAGGWTFDLANPNAGSGREAHGGAGASSFSLAPSGPTPRAFGLGGDPGPGKVNINLTHAGVIAAVGQDELRREREADGERRKSQHRGSFQASNFERWRSAIENYVTSVKPGNQTALNTAAVPFATYINGIHNRIHPIFADSFLGSLESLPQSHPLSDRKLVTRLEIVLTREGRIVKMGIVKTSGITAFDIAALDSVQRASPFGPAPGAIVSEDGQVYLHWEFHRDEVYACSTMNARPFMIHAPTAPPPPSAPPGPGPLVPGGNGLERGLPPPAGDTRQGRLERPTRPTQGG